MKIVDEFTDLPLSRAMKHVRRKLKAGKCRTGGCHREADEGGFCRQCAIENYQRRRKKLTYSRAYKCRAVRWMEDEAE